MRLRLFCTLVLLALPLAVAAKEQTVLQLSDRSEQAQWNTIGLPPVTATANGIHITTTQKGTLSRPLAIGHGVDVVTVYYTSPRGANLSLIWRKRGSAAGQYMQIPIVLKPSAVSTSIVIDMSAVGGWDPRASAIGFQLPPSTDITLHGIELQGWSGVEKVTEMTKCFWTFDGIKAHSINFFWGPLLCSSPVARQNLYRNQPPLAHSGMRAIYAILALGAVIIALRAWMTGSSRRTILLTCAALFCACWILLDIRMGAELLSTWTYDVRSYLTQPAGKRTFRRMNFLPDFAAAIKASVADQERYVLLVPTTDTFMNFMRYQTYPSRPVSPAEGSGATVWLAYERPDLVISAEGRMLEDGAPISPPGQITHEFMKGTFIFRVFPTPATVPTKIQ